MASKVKKSKPFDADKYLDSDEAVAAYITEALATHDADAIARAIGVAAKARGSRTLPEFPADLLVHRDGCGLGCLRACFRRSPPAGGAMALVPRAALPALGDRRPSLADH